MSRLGKSFKNRFLRQALALVLAGSMVMSGMPDSLAAESSESKTSIETEVQGTSVSEEVAEDEEVEQKESSEAQTQEKESAKPTEETETASKTETTTKETDKETEKSSEETSKESTNSSEIRESEESESESEETSETEGSEEENEAAYNPENAVLADGHTYAKWGVDGTVENEKGGNGGIESTKGIYKNETNDVLYIDSTATGAKFAPASDGYRLQISANTKIYIPVKADNGVAKITLYQSGVKQKDSVIYTENSTDGFFDISGDDLLSVECGELKATQVNGKAFYRTELTCTLKNNVESTVICVEAKKTNYATEIISGEEVRDDIYDSDYGNSEALVKYNMEGFAKAYGVTGGGMLKNTSSNYYQVSNASEFLEALTQVKAAGEPAVIEVTGDLNLGSLEIGESNLEKYSKTKLLVADKFQALWHPTLIQSGVSDLTLEGFNDLTIFSSNEKGAAIKHCNIIVKKSTNLIFRNFTFDELWEWDDGGTVEAEKATYARGGYKRNDWDYFCIDSESDGVWIDHCTFYKAYDGLIDIKNPKTGGEERVTISWCKFEPKSAPDENGKHPFYDAQLDALEEDYAKGENAKAIYYRSLRTTEAFTHTYTKYTNGVGKEETESFKGEGYSIDDIVTYTCGHKKAHLLGQSDTAENAVGIRVTFANNSWVNCMERLPRLRRGISHEYNCILDASELYAAREAGSKATGHLVTNGAVYR